MTIYRTCAGCICDKAPCESREALKMKLKGIGVTSIKWKCADRKSRFEIGDPVIARTMAGKEYIEGSGYGDAEIAFDSFDGIVIRNAGTKCIVFIKPGTEGGESGYIFDPQKGQGFCKIPISRLTSGNGPRVKVCPTCENPESEGHLSGYRCSDNVDPITQAPL
jgi:hypothetical protein